MNSVDKIFKLASRFARKLSLAQQSSAQPVEIENVLKSAGLFDNQSNVIAPLLNTAGIPDDTSVQIFIVVDNKLNCTFRVETNPPRPAQAIKLRGLLNAKYGAAMKKALVNAKISVADTMELKWVNF